MRNTRIEWCTDSYNPVSGCRHTCPYCYARAMVNRFSKAGEPDGTLYTLNVPIRRDNGTVDPYPFGFAPTYHRYRLKMVEDMRNWKPSNIFICSMADLFGEWVPERWIMEIVDALKGVPQHNYLFLTKNPGRYLELMREEKLPTERNFWYGSTVATGEMEFFFHEDAKAFLSIEPLLEDFGEKEDDTLQYIDWAIIGAETGNRKGRVVPEKAWVDNIVEQCDAACVPVFMKDSLIPITGEENMRRDMPPGLMR